MITIERPILLKGEHPIENGNYHLATNEIIQLSAVVSRWISNRCPGGIIFGRPRLGKTRAIKLLQLFLKDELGEGLPIFNILCNSRKANENRFFTELLSNVGHGLYDAGRAEAKKKRLVNFFTEVALISGHKKIILFLDEAQKLYEEEYNWLIDIYNELERNSITLTVILVGQEELEEQKRAFINSKKMQIVGRFMVGEYKFSGIKNIDDMEMCLEGYDNTSEYPQDSGWSFTRYYFPEAFENGNSFKKDVHLIYNRFDELRKKANIRGEMEIPMQYFTLVIEQCMKMFGSCGKGSYWPSISEWDEAITISGYIEAEIQNSMF